MSQFQPFTDEIYQPFVFNGDTDKVAVLVHGFPGTPYEMRSIGKILQKMGYTAIGILLPGFGQDIVNLEDKSREDWFEYLHSTLSELEETEKDYIVVAYSFGAAISINVLTQNNLNPSKIIMFAPFWDAFGQYNRFIRSFAPILWPIARLFSPKIRVFDNIDFDNHDDRKDLEQLFDGADLDDPDVQEFITDITIPFSIINELFKVGRAALKRVKLLDFPILVLQGERDTVVPPRSTRELIQEMKTVSYHELQGYGHDFILPEVALTEKILPILNEFLGD